MREGYCSRPVCVPVCVSVCLSVTAEAATVSVYTCNQRRPWVSLRLYLILNVWNFEKPFRSRVMAPICKLVRTHREPFSRSFGTNETQQLREGQLVGRMFLQRLATGETGVKQARYRRRPTRGSEALYAHAQYNTQPVGIEGPWHLLFNAWCNEFPPRVLHFSACYSSSNTPCQ